MFAILRAGAAFTKGHDTPSMGTNAVTDAIVIAMSEAGEQFAAQLKQISVQDLMRRAIAKSW